MIVLLSIPSLSLNAQYWMQAGGSPTIDEGMAVAADANNNIYTTGYFTSTLSMNGMQVVSSGQEDIFISKMDEDGNLLWLKRAGGSNQDRALSIDVRPNGEFIITGYFYGTTIFGTTSLTSFGQQDIFITKYDSSGNVVWAKQAGSTNSEIGNAVAFDNSGNIIVTGEFNGTCNFDALSVTGSLSSIDAYIVKYDGNGNAQWVKSGSGNFTDRGTHVVTDSLDNIYVCGMFSDTISFTNTYPNSMQNAIYYMKLKNDGTELWFRWVGSGSSALPGGIDFSGNGLNITGSFTGSLYFFGVPGSPVINPSTPNNIYIARYSFQGNLEFYTADGSDNQFNSTGIGTTSSGDILICGNFQCQLKDYSNIYGLGVFRSVGFSDTYISSYDSNGNWQWARQYGGRQNDLARDLVVYKDSLVVYTGSYEQNYVAPVSYNLFNAFGTVFIDYGFIGLNTSQSYCSDNSYSEHIEYLAKGSKDVFINSAVDKLRQPLDLFKRNPGPCIRNEQQLCITPPSGICVDSLLICDLTIFNYFPGSGQGLVYNAAIAPEMNINWSNGLTAGFIAYGAPGVLSATAVSSDGCYSYNDSIFITSSFQTQPTITDNKGINTNSTSPADIILCAPDSVELTCSNVGNSTIQWNGFPSGMNPVTVTSSGNYICTLTNTQGCESTTPIAVEIVAPLSTTVDPRIRCIQDVDNNDSITVCQFTPFQLLVYDESTNPGGALIQCVPEMTVANWSLDSVYPGINLSPYTDCGAVLLNTVNTILPGTYNLVIAAEVIRSNPCGSDTLLIFDTLFVEVLPVNNSFLNINILGNDSICPGDTILLVAQPSNVNYIWSGGGTNDSIFITQAGNYSVNGSIISTNIYGCVEVQAGSAVHNVAPIPTPVLALTPGNGIICPSDSVLIQSSASGSCLWYGPSGLINDTTNFIYTNIPGNYYCFQQVGTTCNLLSNTVSLSQYSTPAIFTFPDSACSGEPITFSIVAAAGSQIQWLSPLSGSAPVQVVNSPGNYQCNVTSCGIQSTISASANYYAPPVVPVITYNPPQLSSTPAVSYQWLLNGFPVSGAVGQTFSPVNAGSYSVVVTDSNGCTSESMPFVITGLSELNDFNNISISPNPVSDYFQFNFYDQKFINKSGIITVRDIRGRLLKTSSYHYGDLVYVHSFSNGVYMVEVVIDGLKYRSKIIVQK